MLLKSTSTGGVLAQLITVDAQMLVADALPHLGQRFGGRDFFLTGLRAESPEIEQRLHRQIEGAFALH